MRAKAKKMDGELHLAKTFLIEECYITEKSIQKMAENKSVKPISISSEKFYNFSFLTKPMQLQITKRFSYDELLGLCDSCELNTAEMQLKQKLEYEVGFNFGSKVPKVKELTDFSPERCRNIAKKWAAVEWILANKKRSKNCLEILFKVWQQVFAGNKDADRYRNKVGLLNFLNKCEEQGIENVIIDKRKDNSAPKSIPPYVLFWVAELTKLDRNYTGAEMHRKIVLICDKKGIKPPSIKWVTDQKRLLLENPVIFKEKFGASKASQREVYPTILPAQNIHSQWQCDGKRLALYGKDGKRDWLYLVMDNHSQKILAWNIAASENTPLIIETIDDAIRETGYIPYEFVFDKHSFHRAAFGQNFTEKVQQLGSHITATLNPTEKRFVEYNTRKLDARLKDFYGFLLQGIRAKNPEARRKDESYTEFIQPKNTYTHEELITVCAVIIDDYNNTPVADLGNKSPNEAYNASENKKGIPVSKEMRAQLIRPAQLYTVRRGQITIQLGSVKHQFQLSSDELDNYDNKQVKVVYEDLNQGIYVFDAETDAHIVNIEPKPKVHGVKAEQTEEDIKLLNQLAGKKKGVIARAQKKKDDIMRAALEANPDAVDDIAPHLIPKDIRAEAERRSEVKKMLADKNINLNSLPIRNYKNPVSQLSEVVRKTKSVFAPKEPTKVKKFNPEDFFE